MKWLRASLLLQILLAVYFQAILWFPLGSWNAQPGHRLIELIHEGQAAGVLLFTLLMLLPLALFALAFWRRWVWLMWVGLVGYGAWAVMQIQSWWIPWIFGADQRALRNAEYLRNTYKLFPSSASHLAPDAMHFVLDLLLFSVVATLAVGLWNSRRELSSSN